MQFLIISIKHAKATYLITLRQPEYCKLVADEGYSI
ncbi:MAG: hypothetical protein JWR54_3805 [Mucilaginibacter sp.]|nr:hypothetical protein [Mucilaginibacter sp.]